MNKLLFLITFSLIIIKTVHAQKKLLNILPLKDSRVYYTQVIEVAGVSKKELYSRAKYWLENYYTSENEIILSSNNYLEIKERVFFKELWGPNDFDNLYLTVYHVIRFEFRNGRYKYEISDFVIKDSEKESQIEIFEIKDKRHNKEFFKKIDNQVTKLIISLEKTMHNKIDP